MAHGQIDRRRFLSVGAVGIAASAVGIRAVMAQDSTSTPDAMPGATPSATPGATPASGGTSVMVEAVDIDYEPSEFSIAANTDVEITVKNTGVLQHDFNIEDTDFKTELLNGGEETTITVNLEAGDYTFFCSVPGHREAGMEGTLTVK
jgi:uncharacterized cupredoxin-like copper-binding protein